MCMQIVVPRLVAGLEERQPVPLAVVDRRQPEVGRDLAEAHGVDTAPGVAPNLGSRLGRIPQRDQAERNQASAGAGAPLLDHPVVVGPHAQQGELTIGGLEERLPAEARKRREAERRLGVVEVHVLETFRHEVRARHHVLVGDARQADLFAGHPDGGVEAGERPAEVLVEPPVDRRPRVAGLSGNRGELASDERHLLDRRAHDAGTDAVILAGEPVAPHRCRLDDVIIHRDDEWQIGHGARVPSNLTGRQIR